MLGGTGAKDIHDMTNTRHMDPQVIQVARQKAQELYNARQVCCAKAVFLAVNDFLGYPAPDDELACLTSGFPTDRGAPEYKCRAVMAGVKALALKYGRTAVETENYNLFEAAGELRNRFRARHRLMYCPALNSQSKLDLSKHTDQCMNIVGEIAADVVELLEEV